MNPDKLLDEVAWLNKFKKSGLDKSSFISSLERNTPSQKEDVLEILNKAGIKD